MALHLLVGRVQVFTIGHLEALRKVARESGGNFAVVLGSAQESRTLHNPLTFDEREEMVRLVLKEAGLIPKGIYPLKDAGNDQEWVESLIKMVGTDDIVVWGGSDSSSIKACQAQGIRTAMLDVYYPDSSLLDGRISAGIVRDLIRKGRPEWKRLVPGAVAEWLLSNTDGGITGEEKIQQSTRKGQFGN